MNGGFTEIDRNFMNLALDKARQSLDTGNFPCGAVLVVNNKIVGKSQNQKETKKDRVSHAEMLLYIEHSSLLKTAKKQGYTITMYTTLEPCLMCFGSAAMHRVDRIVAATPDPLGNMSKVEGKALGQFYTNLPQLEYGLCFKESFDLIREYLLKADTDESREYLELFEGVKTKYEN
jgi:tRNA(adenine34) deaminase